LIITFGIFFNASSIVDFPAPGSHQDNISSFSHFDASPSNKNFSMILSCNSFLVIKTSFHVIGSLYVVLFLLSYSISFCHVA
jgi:hypothetical protein